jgi:hypothetical protein
MKKFLPMIVMAWAANVQAQKPEDTEQWTPVPAIVAPGMPTKKPVPPPSDAIVLFDGSSLSQWEGLDSNNNPIPAKWLLTKGKAMTVALNTGSIRTKQKFGSCQLHVEFRTPNNNEGTGQMDGNSGVFLQELYEIQVLNSYNNTNTTYANGQCASMYKQHIPLVNASKNKGEWQVYDIIFTAPVFNADRTLKSPAYVTAFHNGVLVQNHVALTGKCTYIGPATYSYHEKQGLLLQDHGTLVSYRNIWIREL